MSYELTLNPSGHIQPLPLPATHTQTPPQDTQWITQVVDAFSTSLGAGLFALAATKPHLPPPPEFNFWREFSSLYLSELCRTPETSLPATEFHHIHEFNELFLSAPPMRGGEYLSPGTLLDLWLELDRWVRADLGKFGKGLNIWLEKKAPIWHQVGRVCFHLAENNRNPDFPFAFLATYAPKISTKGKVQYQPLGKALQEYAGARNKNTLIKLLSPVQRAAETIPFVKNLVDTEDIFHPLAWTPPEAYELLKNATNLEDAGLLVRLPDWWKKRARAQVSITIGEKKKSLFGVDSMLDFKVNLALGDKHLTDKEWKTLMAATDGLAYIKGQWIEVDQEKIQQALEHWQQVQAETQGEGISFIEGMRLLAGAPADLSAQDTADLPEHQWAFIHAGNALSDTLTALRNPNRLTPLKESKNFHGTLRPYQKSGRDWLHFLTTLGLGACLADDMGLGKTVQIISLLLTHKEQSNSRGAPSLLILPASLLANWKAEIAKFAPSLSLQFIHASETDKSTLANIAHHPKTAFKNTDIVLTTYGMLLRQEWLLHLDWQLIILDEAQAIKNPTSRQTKAVKKLKAHSRIALTGTPIENQLSDLWSLFDFLSPGLLGSVTKFNQFIKALEKRKHDQYSPLKKLITPYILRRLKTDKSIISDLPEKTEVKAYCGLSKPQAALYKKSVKELTHALETLDGIQRRGIVLAFLMRFKQICNHPSQFTGDADYNPTHSGKFARLKELCEEIASRQEKVLIFTQFRSMTEPLADFLSQIFGTKGLVLHGGTPVKKRRGYVEDFQRSDGPPFFVLSIKAGGTGLTLTAAAHVIHFDRWWNPAVENQATDRAFRIGQKNNVLVHKFICRGTIEEKIDALLDDKASLADDLLETGAQSKLTEMTNDELIAAVSLDIDQTNL